MILDGLADAAKEPPALADVAPLVARKLAQMPIELFRSIFGDTMNNFRKDGPLDAMAEAGGRGRESPDRFGSSGDGGR